MRLNKLVENITSLISLKGAEYILNFILFPYLVRILGVERFGAIAFMQGIVQYGIILVDYGFNLTGPRDIARAKTDKETGSIFSDIMASKAVIFFCITIISFGFIEILNSLDYSFDSNLYWAVYLLVVGNLVFPVWFFQGIQQMRYITIFNILARSITVVLVFSFVETSEDYILAAFFQSVTLLMAGCFSMVVLTKKFSYVFVKPTVGGVKKTFIDGWHIFLSTIAINIYTTTNTVILGMLTNNTVVGYFSVANKLIDCVKGVMFTFNQAVYPYVSNKIKIGKEEALLFIKKYFVFYSGLTLVGGIILFITAPFIVRLLFGAGYDESTGILRLMSSLPFVISVSNVFGIQIMLNFGYQKMFSRIVLSAAIVDFCLVIPLTQYLEGYGVAITMVLVESLVAICTTIYVIQKKRCGAL